MPYVLGTKSIAALSGVHPDIVRVVKRAITITEQDFAVHEGLRTIETQRQYVVRGVSRTLNSKHLRQPDGFGHAVDLVPYVAGVLRWEWEPIYEIAAAMRLAASAEDVKLTWGGVWDKPLRDLIGTPAGMKQAVADYCKRHPGPDFIDGPHYELRR